MQYYLRHYFDPDFDHLRAKPAETEDSDLYSLGYVQNAIAGQLLAEVIPLQEATDPDPRFILDSPTLPAGANTRIDPAYPHYLLADANGYVFYYQGRITVKGLLNVRQDVSFHTGNIFFVGDMAVHGSVRSGFSVQANNVRIMERVEGGVARSRRARGGASQHCVLDSGDRLLAAFLEKVEARSRGNMVIDKYCLYSTVYAGANLVVREQLYGSTVNAHGSVYVGTQLGNRAGIPTRIYLGYDPLRIRMLESIEETIATLSQSVSHLRAVAGHLPPETNETTRKLARQQEQLDIVLQHRTELLESFDRDESQMGNCCLKVPGKVYPGVEISIGRSFTQVERMYENVVFHLCYQEVIVDPLPHAPGQRA
ncbi:MAG: FapA family protein [Desulfovibrionaceae bacterium]|nr:FapA family protein [Desulfovibrionaceae bacterium]